MQIDVSSEVEAKSELVIGFFLLVISGLTPTRLLGLTILTKKTASKSTLFDYFFDS